MRWVLFLIVVLCISCAQDLDVFKSIASRSALIKKYCDEKDKYELQIVYTQIDRDENNIPSTITHTFNYDSTQYFYPASTVKMPVAFLALEKLKALGLDKWTTMKTDSARAPQSISQVDTTSITGLPSVAHYIEKIFAVSDNDAYNRLYEFVGQDEINQKLRVKNVFTNSRIVTRVGIGGFSTKDNRYTNPVTFYDKNNEKIHTQEAAKATGDYFSSLNNTDKGIGYYDDALDTIIAESFDMSKKNFINLKDLEASLMRIILPELFDTEEKFDITQEDQEFLIQTMQKTPSEYPYLREKTGEYYDSYVKFFLFGDSKKQMPNNIRIFNKVGYAYGYLTDCAYIVDFDSGVEFFLTTTIHMNENRIYNDGKYEYDEGIKFFAKLGREIYELEQNRDRKQRAGLSKYLPEMD